MDMTGEYVIAARREAVWEALNDPEILRRCIPGCEELEMTSPTTMNAKVVLKIGPVKAKFSGTVQLEDIVAPKGYTIRGEGNGGVAGFAKGSAVVTIDDHDANARLSYEAHAKVGGKLAQLGSRLINSTAKKLADKFFDNFHVHLSERGPPGPDTPHAS